MNWKPNRWIALALGLFIGLVGFLYVGKWRWAAFYFGLVLLFVVASFFLPIAEWGLPLRIALAIITAIQTFIFAIRYPPTAHRPWYSRWYGIMLIILATITPILLTRVFYEPFYVPGASMEPSYTRGEYILISKSGYGNYRAYGITIYKAEISAPLHHGDVVVFDYPRDPSKTYFKRVIGSPGDTIAYRSKALWINGQPVSQVRQSEQRMDDPEFGSRIYDVYTESFGASRWKIRISQDKPNDDFEITVPPHMYFVMGDNRDNSMDSRHFGFVSEDAIIGKVIYTFHH
ncbi:MAG: signal peptidase I [Methylobacillus sp.]|jgi:signal peptidase I|nr:signal peptidase I [Methylobacillus sp.]